MDSCAQMHGSLVDCQCRPGNAQLRRELACDIVNERKMCLRSLGGAFVSRRRSPTSGGKARSCMASSWTTGNELFPLTSLSSTFSSAPAHPQYGPRARPAESAP
jgi:hypothetical protein